MNRYLSNKKNTFADNSRVGPTIILIEKLSFSLKLFSGDFYGQSFIKTVRGPFIIPSVVNYQDGQQISMYLYVLDKLILIVLAIMHLKMVSAAFIRDAADTI